MYGYIYKTTNLANGKIYVGQKKSPTFLSGKYLGSGKSLTQAIKKYGKENFKVELIEEIDLAEQMDSREIYWINYFKATDKNIGYNISAGGNVNRTMVGEHNPRFGVHYKQSPEVIASRVAKNTGKKRTPEQIAHILEGRLNGRKLEGAEYDAYIKKKSESAKAYYANPENKAKYLAEHNTEQAKENHRKGMEAYYNSPEQLEKRKQTAEKYAKLKAEAHQRKLDRHQRSLEREEARQEAIKARKVNKWESSKAKAKQEKWDKSLYKWWTDGVNNLRGPEPPASN